MVPSSSVSQPRSERRIAVHLPLQVRGRDRQGILFEEETSSENLCRSGAAFLSRFDLAIGSSLEIHIPFGNHSSRRYEADFATQGRIVHIRDANVPASGERLIGVRFTGPRFQRVFRSETAAYLNTKRPCEVNTAVSCARYLNSSTLKNTKALRV
jgi:hypothetical protein